MRDPARSSEFEAYWLSYLSAHRHPGTRLLHYVGTISGTAGALVAWLVFGWLAGLLTAVGGYALALAGHVLVERNRPHATRPLWGLYSDFRMLKRAATGELRGDLARVECSQKARA